MIDPRKIFNIQNEHDFQALAMDIFRYQSKNIPVYRDFISHLKLNPDKISNYKDIPFLPVELFKSHEIIDNKRKP